MERLVSMGQEKGVGKRTRVLFVHPKMSPFIQADLDLLRKHFELRVIDLGSRRKGLASSIGALYHMFTGVLWADATFCWFAEKHAKWTVRLSRMLGRPSLVVVGGYEVANLPEIGHGSLLDPKKAKMVRYIHERATLVLPVHESLKADAMKNLGVDGRNIRPFHTGYDPAKFKPAGQKENMALTVGWVDKITIKRKGLGVFVRAAAHVPEAKFVLVGDSSDGTMAELKAMAAPNVEFPGSVPHGELVKYYQRAKVYCQLSMYEGLPNALCEAMLCECVPVGTQVSGIPTAMGDVGFYAPVNDPKAAAEAIRNALASDKGKAARARIAELFPLEKRERELVGIIKVLVR